MDFSFDDARSYFEKVTLTIKRWQFSHKAQLAFLEDLYLLINDGVPANRAVEMMTHVTRGITREVSISISQKIAQGQSLAEGMKTWFNLSVVEIIRVGESGGALPQTMKSAINLLSQQGVAIGAFVGAVSYPLLVIVMACAVIVYLNHSVFEQFKLIKPIEQWPASGQLLVELSKIIEGWWWVILLTVMIIIFIFRRLMTNYTGELRPFLDNFPPFSFYRQLVAARLLETLGLLVENGVVFRSAIKVMQHQANAYMHYHLLMMEHLLSMGKTNIGEVLETGLVNDADLMRLRIMAEVKGFEHGLVRMGVRGTEQGTVTLKLISRIIGGMLLVLGGILVVIIIQGIYMTGMSLSG